MNELKVIGITHHEADLKTRGHFTLQQEERTSLYLQLREYFNINEALILSTCNRTEIYYVHPKNLGEELIKLLCSLKGLSGAAYRGFFQVTDTGEESLSHLFRVAIGLESQVLGDIQIFGQVKQAYQEATDLGMCQTFLHRALHLLFHTHKKICLKTSFKEGAASVSYNAVNLLRKELLANENAEILVLGAGKMGIDVCKNLNMLGFHRITIANRTLKKAEDLQKELPVQVVPYTDVFQSLGQFDIVISTVGSANPAFQAKDLASIKTRKPFACLDLSAPQSFDNGFLDGFSGKYYNLDQISNLTKDTLDLRKNEISKVEKLIAQSLAEFSEWAETQLYTQHIKQFKETLNELRKKVIAEHLNRAQPESLALAMEISKSMIDQIVKLPAVMLRQTCEREKATELSETLNLLFNLEYHHFTNHKQ